MMLGMMAALLLGAPQAADGPCDAGAAQAMVTTKYGRHSRKRIRTATGAKLVRVVMPGQMVTQDYREDRATVRVDHQRRITDISCG